MLLLLLRTWLGILAMYVWRCWRWDSRARLSAKSFWNGLCSSWTRIASYSFPLTYYAVPTIGHMIDRFKTVYIKLLLEQSSLMALCHPQPADAILTNSPAADQQESLVQRVNYGQMINDHKSKGSIGPSK